MTATARRRTPIVSRVRCLMAASSALEGPAGLLVLDLSDLARGEPALQDVHGAVTRAAPGARQEPESPDHQQDDAAPEQDHHQGTEDPHPTEAAVPHHLWYLLLGLDGPAYLSPAWREA